MAARDDTKFVETWKKRWARGEKVKDKWEEEYEISRCFDYWKGSQLDEPLDEYDDRRVQINKVHPFVRSNIPSLYFNDPIIKVKPSPALADTPGQIPGKSLDEKAKLLSDTGNTLIRDEGTGFDDNTHAALKEAHWSFGCCKVIYDADTLENPNAGEAPPLREDKNTPVPNKRFGDFLGLTPDIPPIKEERFYVKRIPSRQVIVSPDMTGKVEELAWIGYWSIHYLEDIKSSPLYKNAEDLKASGVKTAEDSEEGSIAGTPSEKVKLYHIYDQRTKTYIVLADGHDKLLRETKYKRPCLKFLRFDVMPDSFYPIPPIYHLLHPQDEFNDSREWLRLNRKGTVPRYTYDREALDAEDMKKLESGDMGTYIPRNAGTHQVIEPVPQPNYSAVATQTVQMSKEEFNETAMKSGESRGDPQANTATQSKIMETRAQTQESFDRVVVSKFLAAIVREMIMMAVDKMSYSMFIAINVDAFAAGFAVEAQAVEAMWQEIVQEDLKEATSGMKWVVTVEPSSMSPVALEQEKQEWLQTLSLLGNPVMSRLLAISPELRKKTFTLHNIPSARDQELIGAALMQVMQIEMQTAAMGGPAPPGMASQPGAPPGMGSPATIGPSSGAKPPGASGPPNPAPPAAGVAA